ncbi:conjugal transfer protein TraC, partial [Patescibacteria group bacterium]|nr:conjugal transfer protein TraC [Patescibacteria group bacterium]
MFKLEQIKKSEEQSLRSQAVAKAQQAKKDEQTPELTREMVEAEKTYRQGAISIKDLIAPASFQVNPNYLILGGKYVRTIFVVSYPRFISIGWFAPIINLNSTFDIGMFFYPVESAIVLKQLKNKVGNLEAQIIGDAEKGAARDPLRETALR